MLWWIHSLGGSVPDHLRIVLLARSRVWRWCGVLTLSSRGNNDGRSDIDVRWRHLWWIYTVGGRFSDHLRVVYFAGSVCSNHLYHDTGVLMSD